MRSDTYCNCEAPCVHKDKDLKRIKVWSYGKRTRAKVQICTNNRQDCTCPYKATIFNSYKY